MVSKTPGGQAASDKFKKQEAQSTSFNCPSAPFYRASTVNKLIVFPQSTEKVQLMLLATPRAKLQVKYAFPLFSPSIIRLEI